MVAADKIYINTIKQSLSEMLQQMRQDKQDADMDIMNIIRELQKEIIILQMKNSCQFNTIDDIKKEIGQSSYINEFDKYNWTVHKIELLLQNKSQEYVQDEYNKENKLFCCSFNTYNVIAGECKHFYICNNCENKIREYEKIN